MKKLLLSALTALFMFSPAEAQVVNKIKIDGIKSQVDSIKIFRFKHADKIITDTIFDKKLDSVLNTVSGATYVNGKAALTSASVDDKALTVNFNLSDGTYHTWQFTASGAAQKGVVDLFSDAKYSKTITGGFNYFWFPANNRASAFKSEKDKLHDRIDRIDIYFDVKRQQHLGQTELTSIKTIFEQYGDYFYTRKQIPGNLIANYDAQYGEFTRLIKKYQYYLPKNFETLTLTEQGNAINDVITNATGILDHYYYRQELDSLNKTQLALKFNKTFLNWVLFSAKLNHDAYPIFDGNAPKEKYTNTFDDFYYTLGITYNMVFLRSKTNLMFMPALKFQNNHDFKPAGLLSLDIPQNTRVIGTQTVTDYKQTSFYNAIADRKTVVNFELPAVLFFPKAKIPFGLDASLNTNFDDAQNIGGRFGVYVTLPGAKQNVVIEPVIRVAQWEAGDTSFMKDQFSFGISLTVALPTYITGGK